MPGVCPLYGVIFAIFFYYIFAFTRKRKEKKFPIFTGLTQHDLYATGDCHEVIKMLDLKLYNTPLFKLNGKYFNLMKQYAEDVTNHSHAFLRRWMTRDHPIHF